MIMQMLSEFKCNFFVISAIDLNFHRIYPLNFIGINLGNSLEKNTHLRQKLESFVSGALILLKSFRNVKLGKHFVAIVVILSSRPI